MHGDLGVCSFTVALSVIENVICSYTLGACEGERSHSPLWEEHNLPTQCLCPESYWWTGLTVISWKNLNRKHDLKAITHTHTPKLSDQSKSYSDYLAGWGKIQALARYTFSGRCGISLLKCVRQLVSVREDGREKRSECHRASPVKLRPAGHGPITHRGCFWARHACHFAPHLTGWRDASVILV